MDEQEPNWLRQLVTGLTVLVVVALLLGGILAVVAVKAADYVGLGDSGSSSGPATPESILPTTGGVTSQSPPTTTGPTQTSPTRSSTPPRKAITLRASPTHAGSYQRVNLTGRYPGHDGATLQVQRSVGSGSWSDFPTSTHVSGGRFATYIQTQMTGVNHFRMIDKATGKTSNVVAVVIG